MVIYRLLKVFGFLILAVTLSACPKINSSYYVLNSTNNIILLKLRNGKDFIWREGENISLNRINALDARIVNGERALSIMLTIDGDIGCYNLNYPPTNLLEENISSIERNGNITYQYEIRNDKNMYFVSSNIDGSDYNDIFYLNFSRCDVL